MLSITTTEGAKVEKIKEDAKKRIEAMKEELRDNVLEYRLNQRKLESEQEIELAELKSDFQIERKDFAFQLEHQADEDVKTAEQRVTDIEKENIALKVENKMLEAAAEISSDIIDVKELVSNLMAKLPTIDINSLSVNAASIAKRPKTTPRESDKF